MNLSIRKAIAGSIAVLLLSTAGCGGGTADEHLVKAQNFYKSSDIKSAEIELKNALRKDDSLSPARLLLGKIYLEAGRPDFAQTELQRVVDAGTAEEEIYFLLAKAKTEAGNLDAAIDDLKIIKDQGSAKIHTMYGHIYYGKKAWSTAETHYLEALEQDDAYLDAMLGLAHAGVATGKFEQLNKYSTRVTELAADDIRGWLLLAEYHILQRDFDASRTAFSRSLEIDEDNFAAAVGMARTYLAENRYEEAEKYVQIAANVAPEHPHVSFFQAELLFRSGN